MNIEFHIEELVLHGFPLSERYGIAEAVEHELTRLFNERGLPSSLTHDAEIGRINGGAFHATPDAKAERTGNQVARAVYGGLR